MKLRQPNDGTWTKRIISISRDYSGKGRLRRKKILIVPVPCLWRAWLPAHF